MGGRWGDTTSMNHGRWGNIWENCLWISRYFHLVAQKTHNVTFKVVMNSKLSYLHLQYTYFINNFPILLRSQRPLTVSFNQWVSTKFHVCIHSDIECPLFTISTNQLLTLLFFFFFIARMQQISLWNIPYYCNKISCKCFFFNF